MVVQQGLLVSCVQVGVLVAEDHLTDVVKPEAEVVTPADPVAVGDPGETVVLVDGIKIDA
jgi:hypothetical protein